MGKTSGVQEHSQARRRLEGRLAAVCLAAALVALSACSNGSARPGQDGNAASTTSAMNVPDGALTVPVMLPFAVDKAKHELSTEFWVPPGAKGEIAPTYYVGLRLLFTAGDPDGRRRFVDNNPIKLKLDLRLVDGEQEVPVVLTWAEWVRTGPGPYDRRLETRELIDGVAISRGDHSAHSELPRGTPDGAYRQLSLGGAGRLAPGLYRLDAVVLEDQPGLQGAPMYLTVRQTEHSK